MTGLKMTKKNKVEAIEEYLEELYPNPRCELNYEKDYELLIAVTLSAQTTDQRVNQVTKELWKAYPTLGALSNAPLEKIKEILRPIGFVSKKALYIKKIACILLENYDGHVPNDRTVLESFPGVGRKTTNVVLSNLYNFPAIAVDTHVERVSKRLGLAKENATVLEVEENLMKLYQKETWARRHHQMVLFGRYHCKAIKPECKTCKLKEICPYYQKHK